MKNGNLFWEGGAIKLQTHRIAAAARDWRPAAKRIYSAFEMLAAPVTRLGAAGLVGHREPALQGLRRVAARRLACVMWPPGSAAEGAIPSTRATLYNWLSAVQGSI